MVRLALLPPTWEPDIYQDVADAVLGGDKICAIFSICGIGGLELS